MSEKGPTIQPHHTDLEWQRLEIDKQRLQSDIDFRESSKKLESERISLEKSKDRTSKLQVVLPLAVSVAALVFSAFGEYQRGVHDRLSEYYAVKMRELESQNREARMELFKKLTQRVTDEKEVERIYGEIFGDTDTLERLTPQASPPPKKPDSK